MDIIYIGVIFIIQMVIILTYDGNNYCTTHSCTALATQMSDNDDDDISRYNK